MELLCPCVVGVEHFIVLGLWSDNGRNELALSSMKKIFETFFA